MVDWVSYGDQLSVVTVLSESEFPNPSIARNPAGEGLMRRAVTARIDRTLWVAPGVRPWSGEVELDSGGWIVKNFRKAQPVVFEHGTWAEVGRRYLVALTRSDAEFVPIFGEVFVLHPQAWIPIEEGRAMPVDRRLAFGAAEPYPEEYPLERIRGRSLEEVAALFAATEPDPVAQRYRHLWPGARWRAVEAERMGSAPEGSDPEGHLVPDPG